MIKEIVFAFMIHLVKELKGIYCSNFVEVERHSIILNVATKHSTEIKFRVASPT